MFINYFKGFIANTQPAEKHTGLQSLVTILFWETPSMFFPSEASEHVLLSTKNKQKYDQL